MELIKEAIKKAKAAPPFEAEDHVARMPPSPRHAPSGAPIPAEAGSARPARPAAPGWCPPAVEPDRAHLERLRIVSYEMNDPTHVAFNLLRTKVYKALTDHHWRTLAITSPTARCGKTMVAINLAFSLARQPFCRTVLLDLDLKKAGVARAIGASTPQSVGDYLQGNAEFEECFVRIGDNLTLGLNTHPISQSAELMQGRRLSELLEKVRARLAPDVLVVDLPPMLSTDEAIAFLPRVDASLLVVAAGTTTAPQIEECERGLRPSAGYLGVVLNKTRDVTESYYYSGE